MSDRRSLFVYCLLHQQLVSEPRSREAVGAMAVDEGKVRIDKFNGKDFGFWKMQIEDYLYQKKLHEPLLETIPAGMKQED